jgi:polysaccharide pyruvyl transferase WcaK-like protein
MLRIAHFGTFDVENYGDLLFPLLLEHEFPDAAVTHFSPVGGRRWSDCAETYAALDPSGSFDAVIVGGGNLLKASPTDLPAYADVADMAYPSVWIGAAAFAGREQIPLIFNAPGVQQPDLATSTARDVATEALSAAAYLTVRDEPSANVLRQLGLDPEIVPDTALLVGSLWSDVELRAEKEAIAPGPTLTVHIKRRTLVEPPDEVACAIDDLAETLNARPVLVAIGRCHGDHIAQREIAARMRSQPVVLAQPASVRQVAALIGESVAYVGASLHGLITAVAFGRPATQVVQPGGLPKFKGFLDHIGGVGRVATSWAEAAALPLVCDYDSSDAVERVERHWQAVRKLVGDFTPA